MLPRIYIASKSCHAAKWRALRDEGLPIICTWIDQAAPGATSDWAALWDDCIGEARHSTHLIVYREDGEQLRGAYVEMGAALATGSEVWFVGPDDGSVTRNPRLRRASCMTEALARILAQDASSSIDAYQRMGANLLNALRGEA